MGWGRLPYFDIYSRYILCSFLCVICTSARFNDVFSVCVSVCLCVTRASPGHTIPRLELVRTRSRFSYSSKDYGGAYGVPNAIRNTGRWLMSYRTQYAIRAGGLWRTERNTQYGPVAYGVQNAIRNTGRWLMAYRTQYAIRAAGGLWRTERNTQYVRAGGLWRTERNTQYGPPVAYGVPNAIRNTGRWLCPLNVPELGPEGPETPPRVVPLLVPYSYSFQFSYGTRARICPPEGSSLDADGFVDPNG